MKILEIINSERTYRVEMTEADVAAIWAFGMVLGAEARHGVDASSLHTHLATMAISLNANAPHSFGESARNIFGMPSIKKSPPRMLSCGCYENFCGCPTYGVWLCRACAIGDHGAHYGGGKCDMVRSPSLAPCRCAERLPQSCQPDYVCVPCKTAVHPWHAGACRNGVTGADGGITHCRCTDR